MFFKLPILFLSLISLFACTEPPYTNIDNEQLKILLDQGVPIYDVRRLDEWRQTGVIEGSNLLTIIDEQAKVNPDFIPTFSRQIDKNSPVILICRTGSRTRKLATHLIDQFGYTQVYNVHNGITQWIAEGHPITHVRF